MEGDCLGGVCGKSVGIAEIWSFNIRNASAMPRITTTCLVSLLMAGLTFALTGCGEAEKSAARLEAESVHEDIIRTSEQLHADLAAALALTERAIEAQMAAGDTAAAMATARIESKLSALDVRFHDWSETLVEIPGHAHSHGAHDHDHDHGDHEHHHHHHGGMSLDGLSDDEILAIQMALRDALGQLVTAANAMAPDIEALVEWAGDMPAGHEHNHEHEH